MIRQLGPHEQAPMELLLLADPSEDLVTQYLKEGICYVLEEEEKMIGVCVLFPHSEKRVEIMNLAVHEEKQGKGYGKQLVNFAIEWAKSKDYNQIDVATANSSVNQLAFYQKCGFRLEAIEKEYFLKHYDNEFFENGIQVRDRIPLRKQI